MLKFVLDVRDVDFLLPGHREHAIQVESRVVFLLVYVWIYILLTQSECTS